MLPTQDNRQNSADISFPHPRTHRGNARRRALGSSIIMPATRSTPRANRDQAEQLALGPISLMTVAGETAFRISTRYCLISVEAVQRIYHSRQHRRFGVYFHKPGGRHSRRIFLDQRYPISLRQVTFRH